MKNLYISKKNLLHNLKIIKSKTSKKICAVVKANAYGHGIENVCKTLKDKVDFFGVANLEEALEIRQFDKDTEILILGNCSDFVLASKYNISVSLFDIGNVQKLKKKLRKIEHIKIHLKIDTGMNRLGFSYISEFKKALKLLEGVKNKVFVEGIFTHFATLRNDINYFKKQQSKFERFLKHTKNNTDIIVHGGGSLTSLFDNPYSMLRFGIYLYGYGLKQLKPVLKVRSKIISTKLVKKGQNVGYSKSFITEKDCKVAVLPIGYFDGVPRNFIDQCFYHKKQPIKVLSVCMDMTIVELPENMKDNITITVFDNAEKWAEILRTNHHDVLVGFNSFRGKKILK